MNDPIKPDSNTLTDLDRLLSNRKNAVPEESYTASLFNKGLNKILEKVGEEAIEVIIAAKELERTFNEENTSNADKAQKDFIGEVTDLWFHSLIALSHFSLSSQDILTELQRRSGTSGHAEKAGRGH